MLRPTEGIALEVVLLIVVVVLAVLVFFSFFLAYQMMLQNGRTLLRLEALEDLLKPLMGQDFGTEAYVPTLPKGVKAPVFSLPDLNGVQHSLAEWRGKRVLLVFFDPNCTFSRRLLPYLVALGSDVVPGRPQPVVISMGSIEENRTMFDAAGAGFPVLLQQSTEVAGAYKVDGTPMSYLIDADGTTADDIAVGIQAILIQAGETAAVNDATDSYTPGETRDSSRTLDEPAMERDGLEIGAMAPVFRLPRIDGDEVSLLEYRGRDVIVIFFDPECPPCDELAPQLKEVQREFPELPLLIISRGDAEETRRKAAEFGLNIPVAMQRHWEISREYGIFATPAAYFVDEWGTIGAHVAVGPEPIMALITSVARNGKR